MIQNVNRKISLLSFDIDGTLLNSDSNMSVSTISAIQDVMKRGVKVTLSTGRVPPMLKSYANILGIKGPYVAGNGSIVVNNADNQILFSKPLTDGNLLKLCDYCKKFQLHYTVQTNRFLYYTKDNPRIPILDKYNKISKQYGKSQSEYITIHNHEFDYMYLRAYKVIVLTPTKEQFVMLQRYLDENEGFQYTYSMANSIEITAKGTSKGNGIRLVADYYNIPLEEICAFGDYDNDISIFKLVGMNVAMANSSENLKKIAMYHTASNDNEGIAKALKAMDKCFY